MEDERAQTPDVADPGPPEDTEPVAPTLREPFAPYRRRAVYGGITVVLLGGLYVALENRWIEFFTDYSPAQLAAAGGWVSGFGSLAAVSVALRQARIASRKAESDAADAENRLDEERGRHAIELENAQEQLRTTERLHREQLDAQNRANARAEQLLSVRDTCVSLNLIYGKTLDFTSKFRFETVRDAAIDGRYKAMPEWASLLSTETMNIQIARIGVMDIHMQEFIETALRRTVALREELIKAAYEEIVWPDVDQMTEGLFGDIKVISSWATGTMQPSYLQALKKMHGVSESEPSQTDSPQSQSQ
jgi:hypothetical protein